VAFIVAYIDREHGEMVIDAVGVDHADRRKGLGFAVAAAACERARERGARSVALWVDSENKAALGLYEALSFELAGREHVFERSVCAGAASG
jgi:ribosomal protein S18 acetylase RimI-like enzyme